MKALKEEKVNYDIQWGVWTIGLRKILVLVVTGVNPLFLIGHNISGLEINII